MFREQFHDSPDAVALGFSVAPARQAGGDLRRGIRNLIRGQWLGALNKQLSVFERDSLHRALKVKHRYFRSRVEANAKQVAHASADVHIAIPG